MYLPLQPTTSMFLPRTFSSFRPVLVPRDSDSELLLFSLQTQCPYPPYLLYTSSLSSIDWLHCLNLFFSLIMTLNLLVSPFFSFIMFSLACTCFLVWKAHSLGAALNQQISVCLSPMLNLILELSLLSAPDECDGINNSCWERAWKHSNWAHLVYLVLLFQTFPYMYVMVFNR